MRESKSSSASATPGQPVPAKKQKQTTAPQKEVVAVASDSTVDVLSAKIKSQEDTIAKRDEEIQ